MKQIYSWDSNVLALDDKYNNHFHFELRGNKNVIKGCSGTGKTYLCSRIQKIKKSFNNTDYNADNIIILDKENKGNIKEFKNKLIIIDCADLLLSDADIEIINMDDNNRYLIFAREPIGIELSPNHQADLVTNDCGLTTLVYRFNMRGWC